MSATATQFQQFQTGIATEHANHGIYVWGAQGQASPDPVNESWIKSKESGTHETNALNTYRKAVAAGYEKKLKAFDCSGLGMYYLQNVLKLYGYDMSANSMLSKCDKISKSELKTGDWVFRTYTSGSNKGKAYHIGYIVDDDLNVVEAQGRAYGVVKRSLNAGGSSYWNTCGRPDVFKAYIGIPSTVDPTPPASGEFTIEMYLTSPMMRDKQIETLQSTLNLWGHRPELVADGIFGPKTEEGVKAFQSALGLTVDGIVGDATAEQLERFLDGKEIEPIPVPIEKVVLKRLLKRTSPLMSGVGHDDDVIKVKEVFKHHGWLASARLNTFGDETEDAVIAFQKSVGITPDGIVGPVTCEKIGITWEG